MSLSPQVLAPGRHHIPERQMEELESVAGITVPPLALAEDSDRGPVPVCPGLEHLLGVRAGRGSTKLRMGKTGL